MLDFLKIATRHNVKSGTLEIYPKFVIRKSNDLMIRGGDFYAIWLEDKGFWSTEEQDVIDLIDRKMDEYVNEVSERRGIDKDLIYVQHMWDAETNMIDKWHKYCQKQSRDNYHMLDEKIIFSNDKVNKRDYATKRLNYPLEEGSIEAFDKLISVLYSPVERHKIEWVIGAIVTGDSKTLQKFMVLYGSAGTGKSTILNIIQQLFEGYYSVFDAKSLGSNGSQFALEAFRDNPLVAIQHDGDLSKIEDNTRLNSLVSHESMMVNEKYTKGYKNSFKAFLFMGTNRPVKITDAKSGLLRRLIDVTPTGNKIKPAEYKKLIKQIEFELGHIAWHCREVYLEDVDYYNNYVPMNMLGASNDFYNFVEDSYYTFDAEDRITLKSAWAMYSQYCDEAKVPYPFSQRIFREEFKNYWDNFVEEGEIDGKSFRNIFSGFKRDKFERFSRKSEKNEESMVKEKTGHIEFVDAAESIFDKECMDQPAQYASDEGTPTKKWKNVKTKLSDLDTTKLHYVKLPENHIVIDFDIPDKDGNKSYEKNLEEASKWPATYAELSKSGAGIHLHYIYNGDATKLSRIYEEHIEIKVFTGDSSLRRRLSKCNNLPIATISSGLPIKGDKKMVDFDSIKSEKALRTLIKRNLDKEYHPGTKPSVDFIYKILEDAADSGLKYDVTDIRNSVFAFAANSTHQSDYCMKLVSKMKFKSEEPSVGINKDDAELVFYDIEIFPNLFLVCYKFDGEDKPVVTMINPSAADVEDLMRYNLVGFNCRKYDNHMLYARMMGYSNEKLYNLSQSIIGEGKGFFGEAYNISYTDIYDFAAKKQSLKKWEIELGIHHQELGMPWDQPVPEDKWELVADYCKNDVVATEALFHHLKGDFTARQILAELADATVNDTTNSLTTKIIFGTNRNPQSEFNYRNMGEMSDDDYIQEGFDEYTRFNKKGQPIFPGYKFDPFNKEQKSIYRGEDPSEGGYVYSEPGIYGDVGLLDIISLHPTSAEEEKIFGPYTKNFSDIKQARVYIKHNEFDNARHMLNGKLAPYLDDEGTAKDLAQALKIGINSVYGLTSAKFANPFKDPRNIDNIVAKRGALFMINLKHEVQKRGFTVPHIKTDSIKIADATAEIIQFVMDYGKLYGYVFEHEATYDKMCLVNDAVYIARYKDAGWCEMHHGYVPGENKKHEGQWTATGTQFAVPYVFKTLFSKEEITFDDLCETKSVAKGAIYLDMNEDLPDVTAAEKELKKLEEAIRDGDSPLSPEQYDDISEELKAEIAKGHDYVFVGRVGQFCPILPNRGGGVLYRYDNDKYSSVTGTKGYRWLESELVYSLNKRKDIDISYYRTLVDKAIENISTYGDFEWFASDDSYNGYVPDQSPFPIDIAKDYKNYF